MRTSDSSSTHFIQLQPPGQRSNSSRQAMSSALDMSLDDLISKSKSNNRHGSGSGPYRRVLASSPATRFSPYPPPLPLTPPKPLPLNMLALPQEVVGLSNGESPYGVYGEHVAAAMAGGAPPPAPTKSLENGTKLLVSNLDRDVTTDDIKELFSAVGELKQFSINYDNNGNSMGTAEVVFARRADALASIKRYSNVLVDGMPIKLEVIGTEFAVTSGKPSVQNRTFGTPNAVSDSAHGRDNYAARLPRVGGSRGLGDNGNGGGRDRGFVRKGSGREWARQEKLSAAELDAELDKYHAERKKAEPKTSTDSYIPL